MYACAHLLFIYLFSFSFKKELYLIPFSSQSCCKVKSLKFAIKKQKTLGPLFKKVIAQKNLSTNFYDGFPSFDVIEFGIQYLRWRCFLSGGSNTMLLQVTYQL